MRLLNAAAEAASEAPWATALHSFDDSAEADVVRGRYSVVFVSECRATSDRFKRQLQALHRAELLLLIAVRFHTSPPNERAPLWLCAAALSVVTDSAHHAWLAPYTGG